LPALRTCGSLIRVGKTSVTYHVTAGGMPATSQVQQTLNQLGQEGWELADTMVSGRVFMK